MGIRKNTTNLLIVSLLIFNQLGINHIMHFCGGRLFSVSFFNQSKQCGMHELNSEKEDDSYNFKSKKCFQKIRFCKNGKSGIGIRMTKFVIRWADPDCSHDREITTSVLLVLAQASVNSEAGPACRVPDQNEYRFLSM